MCVVCVCVYVHTYAYIYIYIRTCRHKRAAPRDVRRLRMRSRTLHACELARSVYDIYMYIYIYICNICTRRMYEMCVLPYVHARLCIVTLT